MTKAVVFRFWSLLLISLIGCSFLRSEDKKPNIVYIMMDDLAYFELGHMGNLRLRTPRMDRMVREGIRFTNALAAAPSDGALHGCLLTGKHSGLASIRDGADTPLRADEDSIASVLKRRGYATGGFGRWFAGGRGSTGVPEAHGFDLFYGFYGREHAEALYPPYLIKNSEEVTLDGNLGEISGATDAHGRIVEAGLDFIREHKDQPFFAYFPLSPSTVSANALAWKQYRSDLWIKDPNISQEAKDYAARVTMVDSNVGAVLDLLEELELDRKTIVFVTGDNGGVERFKSDDYPRGYFGPNVNPLTENGFRGSKGSLYEGGLKIPFIARWPGQILPRGSSDLLFAQSDILATLAELSGADTPEDSTGISIMSELLGDPVEQKKHEMLYWEYETQKAVRYGNWKAVKPSKEKPWELYNLSNDSRETKDVAGQNLEILQRMKTFAKTSHAEVKPGQYLDTSRELYRRDAKWGGNPGGYQPPKIIEPEVIEEVEEVESAEVVEASIDESSIEVLDDELSVPIRAPVVDLIEIPNLLDLAAWDSNDSWKTCVSLAASISETKWDAVIEGDGIIYSEAKGVDLQSLQPHGDCRLQVDYMIPKGGSSGIYLLDRYKVQIINSYEKAGDQLSLSDAGGIYPSWNPADEPKDTGYGGRAPDTNESKAPGEWQSLDITFRAPRFGADGAKVANARFASVVLNGVEIHKDVEVSGPSWQGAPGPEVASAPLRIQADGPIAFRKIEVSKSEVVDVKKIELAVKKGIVPFIWEELEWTGLTDGKKLQVKAMVVAAYTSQSALPLWSEGTDPFYAFGELSSLLKQNGFSDTDAQLSYRPDRTVAEGLIVSRSDLLTTIGLAEACLRLKQGPTSIEKWPNWGLGDEPFISSNYQHYNNITTRFGKIATNSSSPMQVAGSFVPRNWVYHRLMREIAVASNGSKPTYISVQGLIKVGDSFSQARELAQFLISNGHLSNDVLPGIGTVYTQALSSGVSSFQASRGLQSDGILGPQTARTISTPPANTTSTLLLNLHRSRRLPDDLGEKYLLANLPAGEVHGFEGDQRTLNMRVVFGKDEHGLRTPIFRDKMEKIVFRPYWNIPNSIAVNESIYSNIDYLQRNGFNIVSHSTNRKLSMDQSGLQLVQSKKAFLRQDGGSNNALGLVKFLFPNKHAVYMHDTPYKHFFNRDLRAHSHGCVRLQNPEGMANWVLGDYPDWSPEMIKKAIYEGERNEVNLDEAIPVYITYLTAFPIANQSSGIGYYHDYYGYDRPGAVVDPPDPAPSTHQLEPELTLEERRTGLFGRIFRNSNANNREQNGNNGNQGANIRPRKGIFRRR